MRRFVLVCLVTAVALMCKCSANRLHYSYYDAKSSINSPQISTFGSRAKLYNVLAKRQVFNDNYADADSEEDGIDTDQRDNLSDEKKEDTERDKIDEVKHDIRIVHDDDDTGSKGVDSKAPAKSRESISEEDSLELSDISDILWTHTINNQRDDIPPPEVRTAEGVVRGQRLNLIGVSYDSFIGIPYVEKPIRFQAAKPHPGWSGAINATIHPNICTQRLLGVNFTVGSEDCLYLNVATPSINATGLPVLFVVHGGGFKFQTGNTYMYDPQMLMINRNMIVVSFNYRLGALGFVSTRTEDAPGNVGMKDIIEALRWVHRNIHMFGGDRLKITPYGVSSGAAAIEYLLLSKMAKGMFRSIIIQSGSALNYVNYQRDPLHNAFTLGKKLGVDTTDVKKLIEYLKNAKADDIMMAADEIDLHEYTMAGRLTYVPCAEDPLPGEDMFLEEHPYVIMNSGDYIKVPTMIGFNDLEGGDYALKIIDDPKFLNTIDPIFEHLLPTDLTDSINSHREKMEIIQYFRDIYFNGGQISNASIQGYADLMGDQIFLNGMFRSIDLRLRNSDVPIYYWLFAVRGVNNHFSELGLEGATHADDVAYLFKMPLSQPNHLNKESAKTSEKLIAMVSNFLIYGNPTPEITSLLPVTWYPIQSKETLDYLAFGDGMEMKQDPFRNRRLLWECLYSIRYGLI